MGLVAITFRIMPTSPDADLTKIRKTAEDKLKKIGGILNKVEEQPIAFGLKALVFIIGWPEEKNSDILEEEMAKIKEVNSVEITDVRRAIG